MASESATRTNWAVFLAIAAVLILTALYRTLVPGPYALPGPTQAWMQIGFTVLMGVGLLGTGLQLGKDPMLALSRRPLVRPLLIAGLVACAALLLYRVLSVPGFYHGHLRLTPMVPR